MFDRSLNSGETREQVSGSIRRINTEINEDHPHLIAMQEVNDNSYDNIERHHQSLLQNEDPEFEQHEMAEIPNISDHPHDLNLQSLHRNMQEMQNQINRIEN